MTERVCSDYSPISFLFLRLCALATMYQTAASCVLLRRFLENDHLCVLWKARPVQMAPVQTGVYVYRGTVVSK